MDKKGRVSQVFDNNSQGSWVNGWPKTGGRILYKQILVNAKLKNGKRGQNRDDCEKSIKEEKVHIGL